MADAFRTLTVGPHLCEHATLRHDHSEDSYSERELEWGERVELVLNTTQMALLLKEMAVLHADAMQEEYTAS